MEEAFLRFPHLSETIFDLLDNKSLAASKEVSKSWYFYLDSQKFLQTRIIKANKIKLIKGQLILKYFFGFNVLTKVPTFFFKDFCPSLEKVDEPKKNKRPFIFLNIEKIFN